jgi:flagellar biosynthetic protein FliR
MPDLAQYAEGLAFAFVMVMCRCGAAIAVLPPFAEDGPPALARMGLALAFSLLMLPVAQPILPPMPTAFAPLAGLVAGELFAGLLLGWLARVLTLALPAAGQIMSMLTGLSSVLQPDANFGAQTAGLGRLMGVAAPAILFASGLYALPLQALAGSYAALPPGFVPPAADSLEVGLHAVTAHFALAVRLAAPFILIGTIWQMALGLLSRLVPQLQVYFASLPGQIAGGLMLLAALTAAIAKVWLNAVSDGFAALPGA